MKFHLNFAAQWHGRVGCIVALKGGKGYSIVEMPLSIRHKAIATPCGNPFLQQINSVLVVEDYV